MIATFITITVLTTVTAASAALYLLPVLVGAFRHVPDLASVAVINVLLGWTMVGWVVALAMALRSAAPASPVVQVVQNMPPLLPPGGQVPSAGWSGPPGPPPRRGDDPPPLPLPRTAASASEPWQE